MMSREQRKTIWAFVSISLSFQGNFGAIRRERETGAIPLSAHPEAVTFAPAGTSQDWLSLPGRP